MSNSAAAGSGGAAVAPSPAAFSPTTFILPFHRQILSELAQQDGLVILARGLGLPQLLYHLIAHFASTSHLIFVLNLSEDQCRHINERLSSHTPTPPSPPSPSSSSSPPPPTSAPHLHLINNHVPVSERQRLYLAGGCLSITNRILIVDLLNRVIAPDLISGLILTCAHRCNDESAEGFIMRIYRQGNRHGFVKAFSDEPHALSSGFFGLDKVMKALHLRSLSLYPRFHLQVQASLSSASAASPDVHELYQPLTPAMDLIQRALIECIDLCLSALKQENKLGASILTVTIDTGLTTAFDAIVRRELDPVWHKVSPRSRQLVADLAALRQCIAYLINYDAVTFYRYLLTVRAQCQASNYSMWLLTEPADRLFKQAKSRVYFFESAAVKRAAHSAVLARARAPSAAEQRQKKRKSTAAQGKGAKRRGRSGAAAVEVVEVEDDDVEEVKEAQAEEKTDEATDAQDHIRLVLEENPKWRLLVDVLQEVEDEIIAAQDVQGMKKEVKDEGTGKERKVGRVLVCCHDERTCSLLKRYLEEGGRRMMKQLWRSFLFKQRQRKPHPSSASFPASSVSSTSTPPAHSPPTAAAAPSPWALMAAETLTLRREMDKVLQRRREARLKKFERERQRRLKREEEEKRRAEIGADQVTLTQHVRGADEKKKKEEGEARRKAAADKEKERKRKAEQREKERRLDKLAREEDDDDGILRDVLLMREKRQKRIEDMSDEEEDEEEGEEGMEGEEEGAVARKMKEEEWGVLSVCDVALHLRSSQADDDSLPSTQSSSPAPPPPPPSSVFHEFDESVLHALPEFQLVFHPSADVELLLYRYQPHYVVMFDPDLTLLREVEVYAAYHPHLPVTVYYLQYTHSVEEQRYLSSIKHEKDAFDQLIFQKQHLVVPSEIEGKSVGLSGGDLTVERTQAMRMPSGQLDDGSSATRFSTFEAYQSTLHSKGTPVNTRRGGDVSVQVTGRVIVDVREFRSSLPSLLHSRGLTIVPVTLEVGDYVLSPHICVERKSLSDLFASFLSGRLLKQMEVMCRHYKAPVLLIEFDRKRPFALLSKGELGSEINSRHIMARLAILCLHFPQVRFVWSRDSHSTSSTFLMLKKNQFEPEVDGALLSAGGEGGGVAGMVSVQGLLGGGGGGEEDDERVYAMMSYDMLRKLPGVTAANLRLLVENVGSLKDLCERRLQELMVWMGESNARKLYAFLHTDLSALFT